MQKRDGVYQSEGGTPYYLRLDAAIRAMFARGMSSATYYEIADEMGSKITSSLRRALSNAASAGLVTRTNTYSEAGGRMAIFLIHPPIKQMELPDGAGERTA